MTGYTVAHAERDVPLGDRLMGDVAMTRRALDVGTDVRGVVELHMRLARVPVDTLPCEIEPLFFHRRDLLNARSIGRDRPVTDQAGVHAWQAVLRPFGDALMAVLDTGQAFLDVNVVR